MRIIDAHTHVFGQYVDLAVRVMDQTEVAWSVTAEWHDGFGPTLVDHMKVFNAHPGRFAVFGNVDWKRINEPGFAKSAAEQMARDADAGMRGLKIYKSLGLEYKHPNGTFWRIDDEALDPIWAKAGELGLPVLMHSADPSFFWMPSDERNFWNGVLFGEYAWWTYYRKDYPPRETLIAERNRVIARHPDTTFLCPHVGSNAQDLDTAADDLDALPNLFYDISARIPIMGRSPRRAAHAREFLTRYADRILFGTDMIYDDTNVPTGLQAQILYQPGEFPLEGEDPHEKYVRTSVDFMRSHVEFMTSANVQENAPFRRTREPFSTHGVDLPKDVLEKIMHANAERLVG